MAILEMWDELSDQMRTAFSQMVRKAAFDIQANAAQAAPVDTGFLKNSIYVVTSEGSTYGQGGGKGDMAPEVDAVESPTEATIAVGASYGIYMEYGTAHSAAHPYMTPAVDKVQPLFEQAIGALESHLRGL
jgi:HK97 gp10 family phage protein